MEGIAIYNQLKRHAAKKIVYIDGFACSIASVIAMAGDTVIMPKNTIMMIHNAWTIAMGNSSELRKAADDLEVINQASKQAYLEKAGGKLTEEKLTELLDAETYLTAEQCIELGLADRFSADDSKDDTGSTAKEQAAQQTAEQMAAAEMEKRKAKALAAINKYFG
jgi:ATP-dependent protease ClpP protease subunit